MTCKVIYYKKGDQLFWQCPNNMGPQTPRKANVHKTCWRYGCPGASPPPASRYCKYELCNELARENSMYCTDACRKRKARRDYKLRKKANALRMET